MERVLYGKSLSAGSSLASGSQPWCEREASRSSDTVDRTGDRRHRSSASISEEKGEIDPTWTTIRIKLALFLGTWHFESGTCLVILLNLLFSCVVTDWRVEVVDVSGDTNNNSAALWYVAALYWLFLIIYIIEMGLRFFVYRTGFFASRYNMLDCLIVLMSFISEVFGSLLPQVQVLRTFRCMRLVRYVRFRQGFRELYLIIFGLASAFKAILWAVLLNFVLLTLWSILAVEVLHPINVRITTDERQLECPDCIKAFETVMQSNLTFFMHILAGDAWPAVWLPVIEEEPIAGLIFVGIYASVSLGLLNLILAVIVDRATEARMEDLDQKFEYKKREHGRAKAHLLQLFDEMDADGSGGITLDELLQGAGESDDFKITMQAMDIETEDLVCVFKMMDQDGNGQVTYSEFAEQLSKMTNKDSRTMLAFIKFYVTEVRQNVTDQLEMLKGETVAKLKRQERVLDGQSSLLAGLCRALGSGTTRDVPSEPSAAVLPQRQRASLEESASSPTGTGGGSTRGHSAPTPRIHPLRGDGDDVADVMSEGSPGFKAGTEKHFTLPSAPRSRELAERQKVAEQLELLRLELDRGLEESGDVQDSAIARSAELLDELGVSLFGDEWVPPFEPAAEARLVESF